MNKTTIKFFLSFSFVAAVIATLLLIINALGLESLLLTQIFCSRSILPNPFWKTLLGI